MIEIEEAGRKISINMQYRMDVGVEKMKEAKRSKTTSWSGNVFVRVDRCRKKFERGRQTGEKVESRERLTDGEAGVDLTFSTVNKLDTQREEEEEDCLFILACFSCSATSLVDIGENIFFVGLYQEFNCYKKV